MQDLGLDLYVDRLVKDLSESACRSPAWQGWMLLERKKTLRMIEGLNKPES